MNEQLNQAPCGFLTLTKDGIILSVNETLLRVLDFSSDELVGQHINKTLTKSTRIFFHLYFMQLVTVQHRVEEMYLSLNSKHDEDTPVLINAVLNEQQDQEVISCIIVPIRKRSEYENQLLIAKKVAEDAFKEKEKAHLQLEIALQNLEANQKELLEINKQNQKYNLDTYRELQLAKKIQERSLTKPICNDSIHIESYYKASSGLSGDIYGFYKINEHQYGIILLDVMGHGISSALITMSLQSLFQRLISTGVSASMVMKELDHHLHTLFPSDESVWHYCTAIYLFIDTAKHTIEYVNAGHPPLIYQDSDGEQLELYASSPPLGTFDNIHFETKTFSYKKGSRIILYTDGVSESLEPEPINSLLLKHSALSLLQFKEKILHSLDNQKETNHKKDDQCFIVVDLK
ncbi:PP2C family protein-serine/threonine phosphatase [Planococcus donghaensis]|uniref:Phosphoserine phosphatase n=1 Tax=Planococcus donghaensis TaxID=414778 RepID=A0A1C7EER6_9BACL|nr:SpoIIE family protein phosphatase [Planococcus donghaensis]ANU21877.1 phosphoserine phosphatase [Planococcus donghaensis]